VIRTTVTSFTSKNPCLIIEGAFAIDRERRSTGRKKAERAMRRSFHCANTSSFEAGSYACRALIVAKSRGWQGYILSQSDDFVELSCLVLRLTLSEIYEGIEFPSGVAEPEPEEYAV